jgi:hypothetical protein
MGTITNLNSGVVGFQVKVVNTTIPAMASSQTGVDLASVFGANFDLSRIRGVSAIATIGAGFLRVAPGGIGLPGHSYFLSISNTFLLVRTTTDSASILGIPVRVIIWYE